MNFRLPPSFQNQFYVTFSTSCTFCYNNQNELPAILERSTEVLFYGVPYTWNVFLSFLYPIFQDPAISSDFFKNYWLRELCDSELLGFRLLFYLKRFHQQLNYIELWSRWKIWICKILYFGTYYILSYT